MPTITPLPPLYDCGMIQPYLGAEKEGVLGFGKGMVKGVVGVAVKVRNIFLLVLNAHLKLR